MNDVKSLTPIVKEKILKLNANVLREALEQYCIVFGDKVLMNSGLVEYNEKAKLGYKNVRVNNRLHSKLSAYSKETGLTIGQFIEFCLAGYESSL